ncbi:uncharacterized protein LOC119848102 [Dermochelys coriacea]|uniref:uncharacterized protein LOC119848102 n=1 Tax=Dermochelys coriacea TaxID=27794 RepID=UPI001CA8B8F1|nr:uncharacterized protein LOC119848102 [Dermochelys coriacea]
MGRALFPQQDAGEWELPAQGPPWRAGGPALPMATLRVLILTLLWRGSLSQLLGFTLTVPQSVSVQEGLCVLVPCTFVYPASYDTDRSWAQLYRYWYKDQADVGQDPPVASSDPSREVSQDTQGRFWLAGDPEHGDCSLQINDARRTDAGRYVFRFEKGKLKYNYLSNSDNTDPILAISVPGLTEEPEIQISPVLGLPGTLLAGEPVTVTCTAPGRCSRPPPRVTWTGPFSDTAQDVSVQLANGTWARSSMLRFTPAPGDHGKELVCRVTYHPPWGPSTNRTVQLHVVYPPGPPSVTGTLTRNGRPVPDAWGAEGDVMSLETHEGDSLTLGCESGGRTEAIMSWAKGNESLSPGQGGAGRLELPNLSRGDAGEYRCWAKNPFGSASRALRVHVQSLERTLQITVSRANRSDPQLFQDPGTAVANGSQLTAREGDSLQILCSVASNPPATLGWVRGDRAIEGAHPTGENQLGLELPNVTAEDGELYGCWARNKESFAQGTFQLLVEYSPRPGTGLNSSCQRQGPGINCSCSLRSQPPPWLQWQVDGEPLAGNGSRGALQVSSWAQGDEVVSTLSWTGSRDRGPRIFCLGSNPHGTYAALHFELSPPQRGAEGPGKLLGIGVACGLGVAVGFFLLVLCVIKLHEPVPRTTEAGEPANGSLAENTADDASLIYSNVTTIPVDHKTPAARRTKGIQDGAAAAQGPLGLGELQELHYASIDFSKLQHKGREPPEDPATEYSEVRLKYPLPARQVSTRTWLFPLESGLSSCPNQASAVPARCSQLPHPRRGCISAPSSESQTLGNPGCTVGEPGSGPSSASLGVCPSPMPQPWAEPCFHSRMPENRSSQLRAPPRSAGGPALPMAMLRVLILTLLWRGSLSLESAYSLVVPQSVSVQEGLCVLVPCTFTYPNWFDTSNPQNRLYGHWYKEHKTVGQDLPVASTDRRVSHETQGRFRLAGDLARGDCSLQISDAQGMDAGRYFLRVEKGNFKYSYRSNKYHAHPTLEISVPGLTEEPEIQISPALGLPGTLLAGEPVTVTCTAPGRCSRPPPRVTWTGPFSDTAQDVSVQLANGTWARSSMLRFTPAPGDHGKELVCRVTYHPPWGPSTNRTVQLHVVYLPGPPSITGTLTRNGRPVPDAWGAEGDVMSLETHEGDSLTLGCESGGRTEATLSWAKGNESLSPGQGGAGRLELPNLSRGDAGEYRCWAKNPFGSASRALRVHVQSLERTLQITISRANRSDPQLFQDPGTAVANGSQLTAREGDSLQILCSVASNPPATLGWVRGDRAIEGAHPTGENQLGLELPNVTAEDGELYGCWARNKESFAQGTFQLLVEYSPRPGTGLNSSCQRQEPGINCSCSLRSQPPPWLQWQVDGEPLAGNSSRGALQVSSWAQGDEVVSTLSWTGSRDRGPRIFCLGSNPHGTYAALHFELSPPQRGTEGPGKLLGIGVACGLGVAVGFFLLALCVIKLRGRKPANGSLAENTADDSSLIYSNITIIPMDHKTPAARQTKGDQDGSAVAQGPLGPGEPEELHYASIDFSKLQRKGREPPEDPATEYSEVRLK